MPLSDSVTQQSMNCFSCSIIVTLSSDDAPSTTIYSKSSKVWAATLLIVFLSPWALFLLIVMMDSFIVFSAERGLLLPALTQCAERVDDLQYLGKVRASPEFFRHGRSILDEIFAEL